MKLPEAFCAEMRELLGEEAAAFFQNFQKTPFRGARLNPLKCTLEVLKDSVPWRLSPTPFSPLCFYAEGEEKPGQLAAHHAGMFYSQEPSASSVVTVLDPQPGERVLDLCGAPGGKSTQIASALAGRGLLWANEIVKSRANILLSNLERMGVSNGVVSSCHPQQLCQGLAGYFDRVLVDAPCSGEGMFRRDPAALEEWSPEGVAACANRQRAILDSAAGAVREGGLLVYSTCTFSRRENEETIESFLAGHPEFEPEAIKESFGRPGLDGQAWARRVFPMDGGEGHFVAKLRKMGGAPCAVEAFEPKPLQKELESRARALYKSLFSDECPSLIAQAGDRLLFLPEGLPRLDRLGVLRAGVELGEIRKGRLEPSHGVFMSRRREACRQTLELPLESAALNAFLRGEEISCPRELSGYAAVCVNGVVTGFGKASQGRLKNRYPKGLRSH